MTNNVEFLQAIKQIGISHRRKELCYTYLVVAAIACAVAYIINEKNRKLHINNNILQNNNARHIEKIGSQFYNQFKLRGQIASQEKIIAQLAASNNTIRKPTA